MAPAGPAGPVPFEEMVRRQLRRKSNVVLVDRKAEVLELLGSLQRTTWSKEELWPTPHVTPSLRVGGGKAASVRLIELRLSGPGVSVDAAAPVLSWWEVQSRRMEELCLPLEGEKEETWGERLVIAKKGGGSHYTAAELKLATQAYARVACVYDFASLSKQLLDKAQQLSRIAEALAAQKQLSRLKRVERFAKLQQQGLALAERIEAQLPQLVAKFAAARLPDTLPASLARLRAALPQPLHAALVMTCDEYDGWSGETAAAKRRFRTPGCHALLHAVLEMAKELGPSALKAEAEVLAVLRQREIELEAATKTANAAIEEDLDEAI